MRSTDFGLPKRCSTPVRNLCEDPMAARNRVGGE
jgi:hypothetical protein